MKENILKNKSYNFSIKLH